MLVQSTSIVKIQGTLKNTAVLSEGSQVSLLRHFVHQESLKSRKHKVIKHTIIAPLLSDRNKVLSVSQCAMHRYKKQWWLPLFHYGSDASPSPFDVQHPVYPHKRPSSTVQPRIYPSAPTHTGEAKYIGSENQAQTKQKKRRKTAKSSSGSNGRPYRDSCSWTAGYRTALGFVSLNERTDISVSVRARRDTNRKPVKCWRLHAALNSRRLQRHV